MSCADKILKSPLLPFNLISLLWAASVYALILELQAICLNFQVCYNSEGNIFPVCLFFWGEGEGWDVLIFNIMYLNPKLL